MKRRAIPLIAALLAGCVAAPTVTGNTDVPGSTPQQTDAEEMALDLNIGFPADPANGTSPYRTQSLSALEAPQAGSEIMAIHEDELEAITEGWNTWSDPGLANLPLEIEEGEDRSAAAFDYLLDQVRARSPIKTLITSDILQLPEGNIGGSFVSIAGTLPRSQYPYYTRTPNPLNFEKMAVFCLEPEDRQLTAFGLLSPGYEIAAKVKKRKVMIGRTKLKKMAKSKSNNPSRSALKKGRWYAIASEDDTVAGSIRSRRSPWRPRSPGLWARRTKPCSRAS